MVTIAKPQKTLSLIARAEFKRNGYVLWGVRSGDNQYDVTVDLRYKVTGCRQHNGEECKGWKFSGHCKHADMVQIAEFEREAKAREAYVQEFAIYE